MSTSTSFKQWKNKSNNSEFIVETIKDLKTQLSNFIVSTNYSDSYSLSLRQQLEEFETKFRKEEIRKSKQGANPWNPETILPKINERKQIYNPNEWYDMKMYSKKRKDFSVKEIKEDWKEQYHLKNALTKYRESKKLEEDCDHKDNKLIKFSNENRNRSHYHEVMYDRFSNPIINKSQYRQGLCEMINQGLIPKIADLTPAFKVNGNPFSINSKNVKSDYKKTNIKDEVPDTSTKMFNIKYNWDESNNNTITKLNKSTCPINSQQSDINPWGNTNVIQQRLNIFLTSNNGLSIVKSKITENESMTSNWNISENEEKNLLHCRWASVYSKPGKKTSSSVNYILEFKDYLPLKDDNYISFNKASASQWKGISFIISNLSIILKKLNLDSIHVDSNKILTLLSNSNLHTIHNKDLLFCISDSDLVQKGLDPSNEDWFYKNIKIALIIKIQKLVRKYMSYKKYLILNFQHESVKRIQKWFKNVLLRKNIKIELYRMREEKNCQFNELMSIFKESWNEIVELPRVEIHINSLSFDNYKNTTISNYNEKENMQLSRWIRLTDPNIEIIYISPFPISEDILNYYFAVLKAIGVTNIESRFHCIVPEYYGKFPPFYSLSHWLYYSHNTLTEIRKLIYNKSCYIVPGIPSEIEIDLSYEWDCPVWMGNPNQVEVLWNKSGVKSIFERINIAFPISAWDIKNEEEFFSSLAHLIASYPTINVWIFKINNESNGRGIAYIDLSKINKIGQLQKEKETNPDFTTELLQEKLFYVLNASIQKYVKISCTNIYPTWKEYFNDYIKNKGTIESCPTFDLNGIMGSPEWPIWIEPNGKIKVLPTYDKINVNYFKNILCTSPQKTILDIDMNVIGEEVGNFWYGQNIIGYVTLQFITFHNGEKIWYWGVDIKYGLTDIIASLQYSYFWFIQTMLMNNSGYSNQNTIHTNKSTKVAKNKYLKTLTSQDSNEQEEYEEDDSDYNYKRKKKNEVEKDEDDEEEEEEEEKDNVNVNNWADDWNNGQNKEVGFDYSSILNDALVFTIPYITHNFISEIKWKDFITIYRYENWVYDLIKKEGIIFNLANNLECGIFGISGVINLNNVEPKMGENKMWKYILSSMNTIKYMIAKVRGNRLEKHDSRNDLITFQELYSKIKIMNKLKWKDSEEEKKKLNKGVSFS